MKKPLKVEFAPGCFDNFEGTQEELDSLIEEITRMAESGEILENSKKLKLEDLDEDEFEIYSQILENGKSPQHRKLQ